MNRCISIFLLIAAVAVPASAKITRLAETDRLALIQGASSVEMLHSMKDFPAPVIEACRAVMEEHDCRIADPGEAYRMGDAVPYGDTTPHRRLIWGARIPGYYILHYEAGGEASSRHVMVFSNTTGHMAVAWHAYCLSHGYSFKTYQDFLSALKNNEFSDSPDYGF